MIWKRLAKIRAPIYRWYKAMDEKAFVFLQDDVIHLEMLTILSISNWHIKIVQLKLIFFRYWMGSPLTTCTHLSITCHGVVVISHVHHAHTRCHVSPFS